MGGVPGRVGVGAKNLPEIFRSIVLLDQGNILEKDSGDGSTSG